MKKAAAYIRVSTEDQTEYSPDSQRKKIQEYAGSHSIILPEEYIFLDEGISGRSADKRPAFLEMIAQARQKPRPFDLILVWKFSRFARSRQDSIFYKSMLRKDCGIQVISITEQLSDDPTSILIEALLEAMDEYYSINLAQEVRRGMNEKFSRGGVVSVPPFGYRMGPESFEPDPEKAPFVTMIFQDFLAGMSCRQIAVRLNELGIRTIRGNRFESRSVEYILTNPTYLGKLRRTAKAFQGSARRPNASSLCIVDGHHPPLVESDTFHAVQLQISKSRRTRFSRSRSSPARYMLHGLVRCSCCGGTLTSAEKGRSLQCSRYAKGLCSQSHHIRLESLNRAVISALKSDLSPGLSEIHFTKKNVSSDSGSSGIVSHLLEQENRRLERIKAAYEAGIDSLEEYQEKKKTVHKRIQKLKKESSFQKSEKTLTEESVSLSLQHALNLLAYKTVTESAKNIFLRTFISHITFYRRENAIQIHYQI